MMKRDSAGAHDIDPVQALRIDGQPLLAGDGRTMVHVTLARGDVPQTPPASLSDFGTAIRDDAGSVIDWDPTADATPTIRAQFSLWRQGLRTERVIGDLATVRNLLAWGRQRVNLSAAGVLQLPHARVSPQDAARMAWQLRRAGEVCDRLHARGLGLSAGPGSGLVRGFACSDGAVMVLVVGGDWVAASPAGLLLHTQGPPEETTLVHAWRVADGEVSATTEAGEIQLSRSRAGRLLTQVAPGMDEALIRSVPLRTVFSGLFIRLVDIASIASTSRSPRFVRHRSPHPS
jgi:hypothetical protein